MLVYAGLVLIFQACNPTFDEPLPTVEPSIDKLSCNCDLELYSPLAGKEEIFGKKENPLILKNYDGIRVFEGDIVLTDEQLVVMTTESDENEQGRVESTGRASLSARWPNGIVPYVINSALPNQSRVTDAIAHWELLTDYDFVPRTNQANYVEVIPGSGCSSYVGMVGGRQYLNLASACTTGNTIHELGHAIGLWHEHSRADRDYHVNINWANIQSTSLHNFKYYNFSLSGFDRGAFDFGSIMMYPSNAFSVNGLPTITKKDGTTFSAQRNGLSSGDVSGAAYIYNAINLSSPSNIFASHDGDEELVVTWSPVAGATEYWIYTDLYDNDANTDPELYRISTGTSYSRELGLGYRAAYRVFVAARDANGNTSVIREATYSWK